MPKFIPAPNAPWLISNPSGFNTASVLSEVTCQKYPYGCMHKPGSSKLKIQRNNMLVGTVRPA